MTSSPAGHLHLSCEVGHSDEKGDGDLKQCMYKGVLREWKRSVNELPLWSSAGWCGCWSSSESLTDFTYLFFWLAWPAGILLNSVACTWAVDICPRDGGNEFERERSGFGSLGFVLRAWEGSGSRWASSHAYSSDWHGLHLSQISYFLGTNYFQGIFVFPGEGIIYLSSSKERSFHNSVEEDDLNIWAYSL